MNRKDAFIVLGEYCACGSPAEYVSPRPPGTTWDTMLEAIQAEPLRYRPVCARHQELRSSGRPPLPLDTSLTLRFVGAVADLDEAVRRYGILLNPTAAELLEAAWAAAKSAHVALNQSAQFRRHLKGTG